MRRWLWPLRGLALALAVLGAACTRPAPPGPPLPLIVASETAPSPSTAPVPTATAGPNPAPSATALPQLTASAQPATASPGPASPTPWPTVETATPLFVVELPTLGPDTATVAPATVAPATAAPLASPLASPGQPLPVIASFTIDPAEIMPGELVTLTWQATADEVTVQRLDASGRLADFYSVGPRGSLQLGPPPEQRGEVTFMLFATRGAVTVQASARATIVCPDTWFFANPPSLCPASPPQSTAMQAQTFEHGLMLWTAHDDRIYALYADEGFPRWDTWANAWFPGQPESDPALVPPPGLFQPVRGFGMAWRTGYVSPVAVVRDRLGWATGAEFGVPNAQVQCDSAPKYGRCYLTGPGGVVIVLEPERSGWGEQ